MTVDLSAWQIGQQGIVLSGQYFFGVLVTNQRTVGLVFEQGTCSKIDVVVAKIDVQLCGDCEVELR